MNENNAHAFKSFGTVMLILGGVALILAFVFGFTGIWTGMSEWGFTAAFTFLLSLVIFGIGAGVLGTLHEEGLL